MGDNYKEFWEEALRQIREEYIEKNQENDFKLWFNMTYIGDTLNEISVKVPSSFFWTQMQKKGIVNTIQDRLMLLTGQEITITCDGVQATPVNTQIQSSTKESSPIPQRPSIIMPTFSALEENVQEETQENNPPKKESLEDILEEARREEEEMRQTIYGSASGKTTVVTKEKRRKDNLNESYTFERFIIGENTKFAYTVCQKAAEDPGKAYNPILIYGGVGLGKTHLMQSIGNEIARQRGNDLKICYVSTESFTNECIQAIRNRNTDVFKKKYRELDVLLLDDIHFITGKNSVQEELFYTFNELYDHKKQLVFTCDRPIQELKLIDDRLRTRFSRGINLDLQPPTYETRYAIMRNRINETVDIRNEDISDEVIEYIAKNVQTNVRDLEQCLTKMFAYIRLVKRPVTTIDTAQNLLREDLNQASSVSISIDTIQKVVADHYNISLSDIKSKKRNKNIALPRQIAIYIAREILDLSYPELGNEFGGKDHTTMMHSYEKIDNLMKTDGSLNTTIQMLTREIKETKK